METSSKTLLVTGLRCVSSALAIVTSRQVMAKGFHYPYHLLLVHALAILLSQALTRLLKALKALKGKQHTTQDRSQPCAEHDGISRLLVILLPCLHMACVVGTLLCVYQATFHFITLPVLVMLLVLDWGSIFSNDERSPARGLILACTSICGMAMMFVFDRKLSKGGIIGSVVAIILTILARSIDAWMKTICEERHNTSCMRHAVPALVLIISTAMIRRYEHPIYTPAGPTSLGGVLAFNIAFVVVAWRCNLDYFTHIKVFDNDRDSEYLGGKEIRHLITPVAIVGLVTAGGVFFLPSSPVSTWQHAGFLISLSALYIASHSPEPSPRGDAETNYALLAESNSRQPPGERTRSCRIPLAISITLLAAMLCFWTPTFWSDSKFGAHRTTVEQLATKIPRTNGSYSLDFVVSRYDESASSLVDDLTPLLELEATSNRSTRIIIYNTGNDTFFNSNFREELHHAFPSQPQITIEHRANVGREGAAFLHHITTQWNNLSDHTLFMQAQPHQPAHMQRLLRNYFLPQTSFLSLSTLQDTCSSCENCWDHFTWSESSTILEDIYSRANQGAKCTGFVLTYRGQIVASRKRIQSPGKEFFEDLMDGMTNLKSDKHSQKYVSQPWLPQKVDSLNSPLFGYTLERIWGVLMGCSDTSMALTCPSRLSAAMKVLKVGTSGLQDCQCLDDRS